MKHVFYFIGLLPLMYEMSVIVNPKSYFAFKEGVKACGNFENLNSNQKVFTILSFGYLIWAFTGLFSFNWFLFLCLIAFSFIPKKYIFVMWLDSVLSFIILITILLNAYHFKIDMFAVFCSFF